MPGKFKQNCQAAFGHWEHHWVKLLILYEVLISLISGEQRHRESTSKYSTENGLD